MILNGTEMNFHHICSENFSSNSCKTVMGYDIQLQLEEQNTKIHIWFNVF